MASLLSGDQWDFLVFGNFISSFYIENDILNNREDCRVFDLKFCKCIRNDSKRLEPVVLAVPDCDLN